MAILKIISGGQTGVDRAALDAAMELHIPHGGICPLGRRAEDGRIPDCYELQEASSPRYSYRTIQNVIHSDGTLIVAYGSLTGGTDLTRRMAIDKKRPLLICDLQDPPSQDEVLDWLAEHQIANLNCAGPRESSCPGIGAISKQFFVSIFERLL